MRSTLFRAASALAVLTAIALAPCAATAESYDGALPPPVASMVDENGVDMLSGTWSRSGATMSIGSDTGGLSLSYLKTDGNMAGTLFGTINMTGANSTDIIVSLAGASEKFTALGGGQFAAANGQGSSLVNVGGIYTYTGSDGTIAKYAYDTRSIIPRQGNQGNLISIQRPSGELIKLTYKTATFCGGTYFGTCMFTVFEARPIAISSSLGYQLHFFYASNTISSSGAYAYPTSAKMFDAAVDYCDPAQDSCGTFANAWPTVSWSNNGYAYETATDSLGQTGSVASGVLTTLGGRTLTKKSTGDTSFTLSDGIGTWAYSYSESNGKRTMTSVDPLGRARTVVSDLAATMPLSDTDALGHTTVYTYDSLWRTTRVTLPEGNYTNYTYDARSNIIERREVAKPGSGLADIVTTAGYDASCGNIIVCNKPLWTKDAAGAQTDYTYDATHGGVLTITRPAGADGKRPQDRYAYAQFPTSAKNSAGELVQSGSIWRNTSVSSCITGDTCSTAQETKSSFAYSGPHAARSSSSQGSGDGVLLATSSNTYNSVGDLVAVDGPAAGSDDVTTYRYDAARRLVGAIGPDPDGAGVQKRSATAITYDGDGRALITAKGTVEGTSDADWAAMNVLQRALTVYDAAGRERVTAAEVNGVITALVQNSYDSAGQLICTAQRLNPAKFGSYPQFSDLPASACSLGVAGADGPDRVSYFVYDDNGQLLEEWNAFGTADQVRTEQYVLATSGLPTSVTDAKNNTTTYAYDGFDRPTYTYYPVATVGALAASASDYEQTTYDAAGRVSQQRSRDGQVTSFTYDNLGRVTFEDAPGSLPDTGYVYDNLGRTTSVSQSGQAITYSYDALGRQISETGPIGTVSYQYDIQGRRTRVTWPGDFYVTYEYEALGGLKAVRESGSTLLASYEYDAFGRRTKLIRGDGAVTQYTYDSALRLATMTHDLAGSGYDQTYGWTYGTSGQIKTSTASNAAYTFKNNGAQISRSYGANGLTR
ncbi:hypothetical protein DMC18_07420 [Caulobacter sp. D5]|uniref:RHS repeat protein n=1 Tax=Caulobacter sp. D5 TaxID=357400 RepID=UPI000D72E448|nr:RHS repeat protein [Caulobacter sp. D5]PXA94010.1 hypothetical protein DMC18_07420 [Caulobacter sp. D5]